MAACNVDVKKLLNHQQAATEFSASVFWIRPSLLFLEPLMSSLQVGKSNVMGRAVAL